LACPPCGKVGLCVDPGLETTEFLAVKRGKPRPARGVQRVLDDDAPGALC
jgi:hypothetical protein